MPSCCCCCGCCSSCKLAKLGAAVSAGACGVPSADANPQGSVAGVPGTEACCCRCGLGWPEPAPCCARAWLIATRRLVPRGAVTTGRSPPCACRSRCCSPCAASSRPGSSVRHSARHGPSRHWYSCGGGSSGSSRGGISGRGSQWLWCRLFKIIIGQQQLSSHLADHRLESHACAGASIRGGPRSQQARPARGGAKGAS